MNLAPDLVAYLKADATILGLLGTRFSPLQLPQGPTYPHLVYYKPSAVRYRNIMNGPSGRVLVRQSLQIFSPKYSDLVTLSNAIRVRLDGFRGTMGSSIIGATKLENEIEFNEPGVQVYSVTQDYLISLRET